MFCGIFGVVYCVGGQYYGFCLIFCGFEDFVVMWMVGQKFVQYDFYGNDGFGQFFWGVVFVYDFFCLVICNFEWNIFCLCC